MFEWNPLMFWDVGIEWNLRICAMWNQWIPVSSSPAIAAGIWLPVSLEQKMAATSALAPLRSEHQGRCHHLGTSWNILEQGSKLSKPFHFLWKKTSLPDSSWQLEPMSLFSLLDLKAVFDALHLCALQSEKVAASSWSPSYSLGEIERHSWYSWLVA